MISIVRRNINEKYRTGTVVRGERDRTLLLQQKRVVYADSSTLAFAGAIVTFVCSLAWLAIAGLLFYTFIMGPFYPSTPDWMQDYFIASNIAVIGFLGLISSALYLFNVKVSSSVILFGLLTNFVGGVLIMFGENKLPQPYKLHKINFSNTLNIIAFFVEAMCLGFLIYYGYAGEFAYGPWKYAFYTPLVAGVLLCWIFDFWYIDIKTIRARSKFIALLSIEGDDFLSVDSMFSNSNTVLTGTVLNRYKKLNGQFRNTPRAK